MILNQILNQCEISHLCIALIVFTMLIGYFLPKHIQRNANFSNSSSNSGQADDDDVKLIASCHADNSSSYSENHFPPDESHKNDQPHSFSKLEFHRPKGKDIFGERFEPGVIAVHEERLEDVTDKIRCAIIESDGTEISSTSIEEGLEDCSSGQKNSLDDDGVGHARALLNLRRQKIAHQSILKSLSAEDIQEEEKVKQKQLEAIFNLLQQDPNLFSSAAGIEEFKEQTLMYTT